MKTSKGRPGHVVLILPELRCIYQLLNFRRALLLIVSLLFWHTQSDCDDLEEKSSPVIHFVNYDYSGSTPTHTVGTSFGTGPGVTEKRHNKEQERLILFGRIIDRQNAEPVEAIITFQSIQGGSAYEFTHKANSRGEYRMALEPNTAYEIIIEATGYVEFRQRINTADIHVEELRMDFEVEPKATAVVPLSFQKLHLDIPARKPDGAKVAELAVNPFSGSDNAGSKFNETESGTLRRENSSVRGLVQDSIPDPAKLKVFLDCDFCDLNDIKQNIHYVHYVRDKQDADYHLLITRRDSGSGGEELSFFLEGSGAHSEAADNYIIDINATSTEGEVRNKLLKGIQAGLLRQIVNSDLMDQIQISYADNENSETVPRNHWNNWVFDIGLSGYYAKDAVYNERSLWSNLTINRITEQWKTEITLNGNFFSGTYEYGDDRYTAINRIVNLKSLVVRSGGPHFSWGFRGLAEYSTFSNYALRLELFPSAEYNLYPYTASSRRQLSALYGIGIVHNQYLDTTIFNYMRQDLWAQNLSVAMKFIETWGNVSIGISGISYLNELEFYRINLSSEALFRLYRGLNLRIRGGVSVIHDQFNLPKGGADFEQVLLQQREMLSSYYYWLQVGFNFTFGDIYNSIVNPRFTQLF